MGTPQVKHGGFCACHAQHQNWKLAVFLYKYVLYIFYLEFSTWEVGVACWVIRVEPGWYLYRLPLQDLFCAHSCTCVVYGTSVLFSSVLNIDTKRGWGGGVVVDNAWSGIWTFWLRVHCLNHSAMLPHMFLLCSAYMFAVEQIEIMQKTSAYCTLWVGWLECMAMWEWAREWFVSLWTPSSWQP